MADPVPSTHCPGLSWTQTQRCPQNRLGPATPGQCLRVIALGQRGHSSPRLAAGSVHDPHLTSPQALWRDQLSLPLRSSLPRLLYVPHQPPPQHSRAPSWGKGTSQARRGGLRGPCQVSSGSSDQTACLMSSLCVSAGQSEAGRCQGRDSEGWRGHCHVSGAPASAKDSRERSTSSGLREVDDRQSHAASGR